MQIRATKKIDDLFHQLFEETGCKTHAELMLQMIQGRYREHFKNMKLQDHDVESEEISTKAITKLMYHMNSIAKLYVDFTDNSTERLIQLSELHEEKLMEIEKERLALFNRVQYLEKEAEFTTRKIAALEDAAKTNAEVIASYENYKNVTQPKLEQLERQLLSFEHDRKNEFEQLEQTKKEEIEQRNQTIRQLEINLQSEQQKVIERENANKRLEFDYEKKLLDERERSNEAQRKINLEMQSQLHSERERSNETQRKISLEFQSQIDTLREQLWKTREEKQPAKAGRPPKEKEA